MGTPAEQLVEAALARAVLRPRPYSEQEIEAAETRIAARLANRMLQDALCLDDEVREGIGDGHTHGHAQPHPHGHGPGVVPLPTAAREARLRRPCGVGGVGGAAARWMSEAERHLTMLCRTVVERDGALQHMAAFLARRIPQPAGARVLGCVLQLAGREDSARFWWQFAAGAGDAAAAYCLYLHHLTLGEAWEAELWHRQVLPGPPPGDWSDDGDAEGDPEEDGSSPRLVLRVLTGLRGPGGDYLTARAAAVLHYVPGALHFVDELELPLPAADFAERIEELTESA
ncbi:hypothetical protein ACTWP5_28875 [Streptomyces sp. 4N509B]|uniref:hypothetical protein n=1 Tax=Streptomyces sp. 4N509B TaxID=3457413 RepID=UPI003FCF895D